MSLRSSPKLLGKMVSRICRIIAGREPGGEIALETVDPAAHIPAHIPPLVASLAEREKPAILILDGIEILESLYGEEAENPLINMLLRLRSEGWQPSTSTPWTRPSRRRGSYAYSAP